MTRSEVRVPHRPPIKSIMNDAASLITTLSFTSSHLYTEVIKRYPDFHLESYIAAPEVDEKISDWNFILIAVLAGLLLSVNEAYEGEHQDIETELHKYDQKLIILMNDFIDFMSKRPHKNDFEAFRATIALWLVWNIKQNKPTTEDINTVGDLLSGYILSLGGFSKPAKAH